MGKKGFLGILFLSILFIIIALFSIFRFPFSPSRLSTRNPISINGNFQFTFANGVTGGSGTPSDPYVIEGWGISGGGSSCIYIANTDAHFVIRNVSIHDGDYGIILVNVANGALYNNTVRDNVDGVFIYHSSSITMRDNIITGNTFNFGIDPVFWDADPTKHKVGNISHVLHDIDNSNTVDGKPIYYLVDQNNLVVNTTTFPNAGFLGIVNATNVTVKDLILTENIHGLFLAYVSNSRVENVTVSDNENGMFIFDCSNVSVVNNRATSNFVLGTHLVEGSNNTFLGNTYTNTWGYGHPRDVWGMFGSGLQLKYTDCNIISGNNISSNSCHGMLILHGSDYNTISRNTISNNARVGLVVANNVPQGWPQHNTIYHNNFMNNTPNAWVDEYSLANMWDNGTEGNYWSDYTGQDLNGDGIGDTPYIIDGNIRDNYPLMETK